MGNELEELLANCLAGDRDAQWQLYERYHRTIYRLIVRMVGSRDAPDVVQEVFLRVFARLDSFDGQAEFSTWLYRVAINECLRHRRQRREEQRLNQEPIASIAKPGHSLEQAELLEKALGKLDEQLRAVFLLREVDGLSYDQIASVLEIPSGTVASQIHRAKTRLREILRRM